MYHLLLVAAGGAIGASMRHLVNFAALRLIPSTLPMGTLMINIIGSFAMGVFIEILVRRLGSSNELRLFVATGVLGGFTTFSAFSLDFAILWEKGAPQWAFAYLFFSVTGAILALFLGLWVARSFG